MPKLTHSFFLVEFKCFHVFRIRESILHDGRVILFLFADTFGLKNRGDIKRDDHDQNRVQGQAGILGDLLIEVYHIARQVERDYGSLLTT